MLKLGEIFFKFRGYTPIPFFFLMVVYAKADRNSLIIGTILMMIGEIIRIHGVSHIGGVSRTKSYSTGQKLVTGGPFSRVRNPLYIGNLFLSSGLVVAANLNVFFPLVFVFCFFGQYIPIVLWEESNLKNVFGKEFEEYCQKVPRWIPAIFPKIQNIVKKKAELKYAIASEKSTIAAVVLTYLIILWRSGWIDSLF